MKSPDKIKKGLECCRNLWDCKNKDCPYLGDGCYPKLHEDIKTRMEQLEADVESLRKFGENLSARNEEFHGKLIDLEAERDAAVEDLESYATLKCFACKYYTMEPTEAPCNECKIMGKGNHDMFEWRGVQKEESDA